MRDKPRRYDPVMEFLRFMLVGCINTATGLTVTFGAMHGLGCSYWLSALAGLVAGGLTSFTLNRRFTFRGYNVKNGAWLRFAALTASCYLFAYSISYRLSAWLLEPLALQTERTGDLAVLLGMAIYNALNYLGQKHYVFRESRNVPAKHA